MDEMKSALERALERAERMGKLSEEEMRQQKEAKYVPIGEAIAQRFFEHGYSNILAEQLDKFDEEGKAIASKAAFSMLLQSIDLENKALTERALEAINDLKGSATVGKLSGEIMKLYGQYAWQKKLWNEENADALGREVRERLVDAGISGNAVGEINIQTSKAWEEMSTKLGAEFNTRLDELKNSLASAIHEQMNKTSP